MLHPVSKLRAEWQHEANFLILNYPLFFGSHLQLFFINFILIPCSQNSILGERKLCNHYYFSYFFMFINFISYCYAFILFL